MLIGSSTAHTNAGTLFVYHHDSPVGNHTVSGLSGNFLAQTAPALKPLTRQLAPFDIADVIEPRSRAETQPGLAGHEYPGSAKYSRTESSTSLHEQGVWDAENVAKAIPLDSPSERRSSTDSRESTTDLIDISDLLKRLPRIATPANAFARLDAPPPHAPFPDERHRQDLVRQEKLETLIADLRARTETVQQRRVAGMSYLADRVQTQPIPIPRPTRVAPQLDRPYGRPPLGRNRALRYTPESPVSFSYLFGTTAHVADLLARDHSARPVRRSYPVQKREGSMLESQRGKPTRP